MYYIYRHIRLDKNEVFYIGIGSDKKYRRAYSNKYRNIYWQNIVNKTNYEVEIILDNLEKEYCIKKEIEFIEIYGRKDLEFGTLVNMTNGGEGIDGFKHSDESKKKISEFQKKKIFSNETKEKISKSKLGIKRGNIHNEESKRKISEYQKNKKITEETRLKMILAWEKRKQKKI